MNGRKKIFLTNTGCSRRYLDSSRLAKYFQLNQCDIVKNPQKADCIIFGACGYKNDAIEASFASIEALSQHKGKLIVVGCLPAIAPERFKEEAHCESIVAKELYKIDTFFPDFKIKFSSIPDVNDYPDVSFFSIISKIKYKLSRYFTGKYPFQYIKNEISTALNWNNFGRFIDKNTKTCYLRISEGCLGSCSYCSIRKAIGRLKSKPLKVCLNEYKKLLDEKYRNFIFAADDTGAYGLDIDSNLQELLKEFSNLDKGVDVKWSFEEFHPIWLIKYRKELLETIRNGKIKRLVCSIQSGSERILKLMNRYSNVQDVVEILAEFKQAEKNLKLDAHLIIGFPSETENDLLLTLDLAKEVRFDFVHLFKFGTSENTEAAHFDGQIEKEIVSRRLRKAIAVLEKEGIKCGCSEF